MFFYLLADGGLTLLNNQRMKQAGVEDGGKTLEYLSTHPSHDKRIAKINEWMPEALEEREKSGCHQVFFFSYL